MEDCIFCKIADGKIPSMMLYEDEICKVYLDINPDSNGHTLIIPKKHYKDIFDLPIDVHSHIYTVAKKIMKVLEETLKCDGFILQQNNGFIQEVKHFHLHIKPCYKDYKTHEFKRITENIKDPKEIYEILKEA